MLLALGLKVGFAAESAPVKPLTEGWQTPPPEARVRCWWWWLNGNVDAAGLTRDLEAMHAQGFGGANIIDAGGANQRGNLQVPHGPDFGSPEWRELFRHAVAEADRLGLELGFNIQSGWNLGGPSVTPEHAAKKLTFSERNVSADTPGEIVLATPRSEQDYYRDIAVLAIPVDALQFGAEVRITADRSQPDHPPEAMYDGDPNTFWVSAGETATAVPNVSNPCLLRLNFAERQFVDTIEITPREGYGPARGWVQMEDRPGHWRVLRQWKAARIGATTVRFPRVAARRLRLVIVDAHDPQNPLSPRNIQIAELTVRDGAKVYAPRFAGTLAVQNFRQKAYYDYPGAFTATKAEHLLTTPVSAQRTATVLPERVVDVTRHLQPNGRLDWRPPSGAWRIVRLGYTLAGSRVSTSSEGWDGLAIDYLDSAAFESYWNEVVEPILADVKPFLGKSLKYLHTDSWELGPINWTPRLLEEFETRRGYSLGPYLPALAGHVVQNVETTDRVLADFRRTLSDLIIAGNYRTFSAHAHKYGLGIHPESAGPHAVPIDALECLGVSDIPMGEFWARSPTHRVLDAERFFTKQPASAAHVYGKRFVLAEAFTTIGPHWEEDPRSLKPVFDQAACEGLNLTMFHTFDSSPASAGMPGQAYFAGSHVNPNTTWWPRISGFTGYLNRAQFLLQQGQPVSDVLYFYGENIPSFVRLQADNPAGLAAGYDYDVINAHALVERTSVKSGRIVLPEGTSYRVLALPSADSISLRTLRHIAQLVDSGATVVGPQPAHPLGLEASAAARQEFATLCERLWHPAHPSAPRVLKTAPSDLLRQREIAPDFAAKIAGSPAALRYIHRHTPEAEIYFVACPETTAVLADCTFRVAGRQPEIWDPVTGERRPAVAFRQADGRTTVPLDFAPEGAMFVLFTTPIAANGQGTAAANRQSESAAIPLTEPWQVQFDSAKGGPNEPVAFANLSDWSQHGNPSVRYYSGPAVYRTTFARPTDVPPDAELWLDLGEVKNVAHVTVNGQSVGTAWTPPFRVKLPADLKQAGNSLEVEITNLWPNRLIGDASLPAEERVTRTNVTKFTAESPLLPSGLLGPVTIRFLGGF